MCIRNGGGVKIASKNKTVYKVVYKRKGIYILIFRKVNGHPAQYYYSNDSLSHDFKEAIKNKAVGFNNGYGFGCFLSKERARLYKREVIRLREYSSYSTIVKCIIPKGTKYECGIIERDLIGGGLPSIRAEELKFIEKVSVKKK